MVKGDLIIIPLKSNGVHIHFFRKPLNILALNPFKNNPPKSWLRHKKSVPQLLAELKASELTFVEPGHITGTDGSTPQFE